MQETRVYSSRSRRDVADILAEVADMKRTGGYAAAYGALRAWVEMLQEVTLVTVQMTDGKSELSDGR